MAHEKVLHILPSDERNMFTESLAIRLNQPVTMSILLVGHPSEQFRLGREVRAKRFGKVAIDVGVLFLGCDGEGEYLRLIQVTEVHDSLQSQGSLGIDIPLTEPRVSAR